MESSPIPPTHAHLPSSFSYLPSSILVRGVNWLGDAVMTTPALQRLRERFPRAHIALLTHGNLADVWLRHPSLDVVITFTAKEGPWSVGRRLRTEAFTTALVLPNSPRSALEVWLAGIPQRIGYGAPWRNWFLTCVLPTRPGHARTRKRSAREIRKLIHSRADDAQHASTIPHPLASHQIHQYLHLTAALGANPEPLAPKLEITATELQQAEHRFLSGLRHPASDRAPAEPLILAGLNPGARYGPAKRWSAENFAAVARQVSRKLNHCLWLGFGGPTDWKLTEDIARLTGVGVCNLAGKTSLRELMALLKLCRVLLTNDTGPMHLAAALGTPVVAIFGSTSPEMTGPGLPGNPHHHLLKSNAACSPCFRRVCPIDFRCMTGISVERVVDAVGKAYASGPPRPL